MSDMSKIMCPTCYEYPIRLISIVRCKILWLFKSINNFSPTIQITQSEKSLWGVAIANVN